MMGQLLSYLTSSLSLKPQPKKLTASLIQPSISGDIETIKQLIGGHVGEDNDNDYRIFVNATDSEGNAAVHAAAFAGKLDVLKFLIDDCHASITPKNKLGCTPLWLAAGYGHEDVLEYLLQKGNNSDTWKDDPTDHLNSTGDSPLLAAASRGHTHICEALLNHAAHSAESDSQVQTILCTCNRKGDSPLSVSTAAGHEKTVDSLLEWEKKCKPDEGNLNRINDEGVTPLLISCERNHNKIAAKLIKRGALPIADKNGESPLAVASFCGCEDVVLELLNLEFGQKLLNLANPKTGNTPLWLAARTGNDKMVKILISNGADETIANKENLTPYDAAIQFKKQKVIDFFDARKELKQ